jgi:hypothetical protein
MRQEEEIKGIQIDKEVVKVHLETQKTINNQGNIEQKEQCWRYHNT